MLDLRRRLLGDSAGLIVAEGGLALGPICHTALLAGRLQAAVFLPSLLVPIVSWCLAGRTLVH